MGPHHEQCRTLAIFPPKDCIRAKLLEVEVRVKDEFRDSVAVNIGQIAAVDGFGVKVVESIGIVAGPWIGDLLKLAIVTGGYEGLHVELQ